MEIVCVTYSMVTTRQFWSAVLHWIAEESAIRGQPWVSPAYLKYTRQHEWPRSSGGWKKDFWWYVAKVISISWNKIKTLQYIFFNSVRKKKVPFKLRNIAASEEVKTVQIHTVCSFNLTVFYRKYSWTLVKEKYFH